MTNPAFVSARILDFLAREGKPVPCRSLIDFLGWNHDDTDDRRLREIYATLPIITSSEGLSLPRSAADIERYAAYIAPHVSTEILRQKMARLREFYPHYFKSHERQLTLGLEG